MAKIDTSSFWYYDSLPHFWIGTFGWMTWVKSLRWWKKKQAPLRRRFWLCQLFERDRNLIVTQASLLFMLLFAPTNKSWVGLCTSSSGLPTLQVDLLGCVVGLHVGQGVWLDGDQRRLEVRSMPFALLWSLQEAAPWQEIPQNGLSGWYGPRQ